MANAYEMEVLSQPSLYQPIDRHIKIYCSEPKNGINSQTGLLLLVAGYGGHAQSNVFKKMRDTFADTYNLVAIQCDYFGYEYMQTITPRSVSLKDMKIELEGNSIPLVKSDSSESLYHCIIPLQETLYNFNDMGIVQAMDNLVACHTVMINLKNKGVYLNKSRIIAYGFSHGAYITYLCNAFMPHLFSAIIDNSSYLEPAYLNNPRYQRCEIMSQEKCIGTILVKYSYILNDIIFDKEIYQLEALYHQLENYARIISFHGSNDKMTPSEQKQIFIQKLKNSICEIIGDADIDYNIFYSTEHGLGADFVKLFHYVALKYDMEQPAGNFTSNTIATERCIYRIIADKGRLKLEYEFK